MKRVWHNTLLGLCAALMLSACGATPSSPLPTDNSLATAPVAGFGETLPAEPETNVSAATPAPEKPKRLLGFLRRKDDTPPPVTAPVAVVAAPTVKTETVDPEQEPLIDMAAPAVPVEPSPATPEPSINDADIAALSALPIDTPEPSRRPRLLGFFAKRAPGETPPAPAQPETVALAAAPAPETPTETPTAERPRKGLFARPRANTPAATSYNPTLVLPFGEVQRVCDVNKRDMGAEVARSSNKAYRLFDTDPSSTLPRTQFLTGFKDGCARQFTGALALFGAPAVHEATRYDAANTKPYSQTDTAYEKIKNRVCGVRRGEFCPEKRSAKLAKEATFVTIYPGFGATAEWLEIFLHKGQLVTYQTQRR